MRSTATEDRPLPREWPERHGIIAAGGRVALLLGVSATLFFFNLGTRVVATNDEARFPVLARDILREGHWLLPRLDGIPHLNKPPLQAWLIALAAWPTGAVTQWTASLPSVLAALAVVLTTYWIGLRLFGAERAVVAGLTSLTTVGVFSFARVPMPDMTFCAAITGALAAYVAAEFGGRRWALVVFYGLIGMAFWAKGPAGLLPLAVVAVYLGLTYGWPGLRHLVSAPGMLLLALLVGAWVVLIVRASRTEQFVNDVVVADLLLWYVPTRGPGWRQVLQPPLQALAILLPWSVLLPGAIWTAFRSSDSESARRTRFLVLWLGVVFVLVAVTREQRMRYYLPLCPPAALLIAGWYATLRSRRRALGFACVWVLAVAGGLTVDSYARARHNARTDLDAASRELSRATRVYAVDAPELVFAFYLERPVTILPAYHDFEARSRPGHEELLIIAERAMPASLGDDVHRVATAVVDRRRLSILASGRLKE
jgi:4-amino-4-deoxy-L-arabinose transferase-like glycosyltransferase